MSSMEPMARTVLPISPGGPQIQPPPDQGDQQPAWGNSVLRPNLGTTDMLSAPPVGGLNAVFANRLGQLAQAVQDHGGDLYMYSGARSPEAQQDLFSQAVAKYGDEKLAAQYVAKPGESDHEDVAGMRRGLGQGAIAADLRGDLALAYKLAPLFGLAFGAKNAPWHVGMPQ